MPFGSKVVTIAALTLALTAPAAVAQEEGVTVDPGSPSGKEYALPIDKARRDATGGGGRSSTPGRPTPAFGEGVRPDRESGPGGAEESTSRRSRGADGTQAAAPTTTSAQRAKERDDIDRAIVRAGLGDRGAGQGSLALLAGGIGVMVLGLSVGLALRRSRT